MRETRKTDEKREEIVNSWVLNIIILHGYVSLSGLCCGFLQIYVTSSKKIF